jgi:translation initiation factor 1
MKGRARGEGGLVYSTDGGTMCPACRQPLARCTCRAAAPFDPVAALARVARETKGRGGKTVTVVRGLALDAVALARLGKELRSACGAGGTAKDGAIEIQGDHVERVVDALHRLGHSAKRAGA